MPERRHERVYPGQRCQRVLIRTLIRDLERFPGAWAVPSQWPTNRWAEAAAQRSVNQLLGAWSHRILAPVYALGASKLLLQDTVTLPLPAALNNASREIALQVLELLGIEIADDRWLNVRNSLMTPAAQPAGLAARRNPRPS